MSKITYLALFLTEKFSLFTLLAYFCYYSWVSLHFLILFINLTVLFSLFFNLFSTFLAKSFHFQLNKLFLNGHLERKMVGRERSDSVWQRATTNHQACILPLSHRWTIADNCFLFYKFIIIDIRLKPLKFC